MNCDIKVSIIVPVYNVEVYLKECLESILIQSYDNYEIICVNDASTDNSSLILEQYVEKDERIRVLNNQINRGLSYSRNRGISEAKGEYIMFVDSDDMIKENAVESLIDILKEKKFPQIIYYDMEIRNEGSWAKEQVGKKKNSFNYNNNVYVGLELYEKFNNDADVIVEACRQLINKNFLVENNISFYEGIYHEDVLFSFQCAMIASEVVYYQKEIYIYRRRDNSIMAVMNYRRVQSYYIVFIELWNYWKSGEWTEGINKLFEKYLKEVYKLFIKGIKYYPNQGLQHFGNSADVFMYDILKSGINSVMEYVNLKAEDIVKIKKASQVMVYGAGNIGGEVVQFLQNQNIKVEKIIVTSRKSNAEMVLGIPVVQLEDVDFDEEVLVIVAILRSNKNAVEAVIDNLKGKNISKIMMYDGEL
ncbi:MAG: glycosyltransferase [Lachnospiraceae bacterium]|nr:glycosyltransferase [Lachnospiraceae bacterium]